MHLKVLLLLTVSATYALAAAAPISESDFFYRVINAAIFFGILYYLIADTVKNFFKNRSSEIAQRLEEVSKKLQASKQAKKDAQLALDQSRARATQIIENAKKECQLISKKHEEQTRQDILNLQKAHEEKLKLEQSKVTKEVVQEILDELLEQDVAGIDHEKFVKLVQKKVA
jgi:F-type H+-transporting ATPase subunit b